MEKLITFILGNTKHKNHKISSGFHGQIEILHILAQGGQHNYGRAMGRATGLQPATFSKVHFPRSF